MLPMHRIPLGCCPFGGDLGVPMDQGGFGPSGVWAHGLRIGSAGALPTELRGQHGSRLG